MGREMPEKHGEIYDDSCAIIQIEKLAWHVNQFKIQIFK